MGVNVGNCKTCEFWEPIKGENAGQCLAVRLVSGDSPSVDFGSMLSINVPLDLLDEAGHDAVLMTRANFGCVVHQPKSEVNAQ
jgi:hypothetical protein